MTEAVETSQRTADLLKERRRLARMRMGQDAPEFHELRSEPDVRVALVPLTEYEHEQGLRLAALLDIPDNPVGFEMRDRWNQVCDLAYAIREPNDPVQRMFESPEELSYALTADDVNFLGEMYMRMMDYSSPALEGLSDEALEELKKAFMTIDLSALSGKSWWHLRMFFLTLTPGQLRVKLPGFFSTLNSTTTTEEGPSTPTASPS
jgi:hypothetical protein